MVETSSSLLELGGPVVLILLAISVQRLQSSSPRPFNSPRPVLAVTDLFVRLSRNGEVVNAPKPRKTF